MSDFPAIRSWIFKVRKLVINNLTKNQLTFGYYSRLLLSKISNSFAGIGLENKNPCP